MYFADLANVTSNFTAIFSIVATLAAIVLGFLSAKQKVTVVSLEESNKAYQTLRETDLLMAEAKKKEFDTIIEARNTEIGLLKQKSQVLEEQVTQAPSINELAVQLATQHKEMLTALGNMTKELGNVARAVSKETIHADKR